MFWRGREIKLIIFDVDGTLTVLDEPNVAMKGVIQTLTVLKEDGLTLAICTVKDEELLRKRFAAAGIDLGQFDFLVTNCLKYYTTQAVIQLQQALEKSGVNRARIIYLGDTEYDFLLASACDVEFIGVGIGLLSEDEFLKAGVRKENIIASVNHLPGLLGLETSQQANLQRE